MGSPAKGKYETTGDEWLMNVAGKGTLLSNNSLTEVFLPWFSLKHIELKMIAVTLALVMTFGIGTDVNYTVKRNLSPFFLSDTLIDSSVMYIPFHDSAGR
jgi:hypothetical protein